LQEKGKLLSMILIERDSKNWLKKKGKILNWLTKGWKSEGKYLLVEKVRKSTTNWLKKKRKGLIGWKRKENSKALF